MAICYSNSVHKVVSRTWSKQLRVSPPSQPPRGLGVVTHVWSKGSTKDPANAIDSECNTDFDCLHSEAVPISVPPNTCAASAQRQRRTKAYAVTREVQLSLPTPHTEEVLLHQNPQRVLMHRILHSHWQSNSGCSLDAMSVDLPSAAVASRGDSTDQQAAQSDATSDNFYLLAHPGSLACSRMEVTRDASAKSVHITLNISVRSVMFMTDKFCTTLCQPASTLYTLCSTVCMHGNHGSLQAY